MPELAGDDRQVGPLSYLGLDHALTSRDLGLC